MVVHPLLRHGCTSLGCIWGLGFGSCSAGMVRGLCLCGRWLVQVSGAWDESMVLVVGGLYACTLRPTVLLGEGCRG